MSKTLEESIKFAAERKKKAAIFCRTIGVVTFKECKKLIDEANLDNKGNRDEDLDTTVKYYGKLHHLIRYMSGISEKGQLLVSVLKDTTDKVGFIRDNGTMFSLLFGRYYNEKVLTGRDWQGLLENASNEYDIHEVQDRFLIDLIVSYFDNMSENELELKFSLEDVFTHNSKISEIYDNTQIGFVVSLHTVRQFQKDMQNCNRQPHPWLAYNYYMTPHKRTEEYKTKFIGDKLIEFFNGKEGVHTFQRDTFLNSHKPSAQKHKVARMIPILQAYIGSRYCETLSDFEKFNKMVFQFENGTKEGDVQDYWSEMFLRVVTEAGYHEIIKFYKTEYLKVYQSTRWNDVTETLNIIKNDNFDNKSISAWSDLHIKKYHTGIVFLSMALFFKRTENKSWDVIIDLLVNEYQKLLNGNITEDGTPIKTWEYFGTRASYYNSTSGNVRWDKLFQYVFKNVVKNIKNRSKDRDDQSKFRKDILSRIARILNHEDLSPIMKIYPLSTDVKCSINWNTGAGLHWLHKSPHSNGGNASDGFLGMKDDNLTGNMKYKNWDCTPEEYLRMLVKRNEDISETLNDREKKKLLRQVDTLELISDQVNLNP